MSKNVVCLILALLIICLSTLQANAQPKKRGPQIEPYVSEEVPSNELIALICRKKPDQVMGKIETGTNQYTVYIAVIANRVIQAQATTLVKLDSNMWVIGCFASIPQVVMQPKK